MSNGFMWDLADVDRKTASIKSELNTIADHTETFSKKSSEYRKKLQDQISEDVGKCIKQIQADADQLLKDVTELNRRIHDANIVLGDNEHNNPVQA